MDRLEGTDILIGLAPPAAMHEDTVCAARRPAIIYANIVVHYRAPEYIFGYPYPSTDATILFGDYFQGNFISLLMIFSRYLCQKILR